MILDQNGNHLIYDAWNELVRVNDSGDGQLILHNYDGLGRQIDRWDGSWHVDYLSPDGTVMEDRLNGDSYTIDQYVRSFMYVNALIERDRDADGLVECDRDTDSRRSQVKSR